jgi:hypothetical protein
MNNSVHVCGIYDTTMIILHTEISCVLYNFHSFANVFFRDRKHNDLKIRININVVKYLLLLYIYSIF